MITIEEFLAMLPANDPRRPVTPDGLLVMEAGVGVYYPRVAKPGKSVWGQWRYLRRHPDDRVLKDVPNPIRTAEPIDPALSGHNKPAQFGLTALA